MSNDEYQDASPFELKPLERRTKAAILEAYYKLEEEVAQLNDRIQAMYKDRDRLSRECDVKDKTLTWQRSLIDRQLGALHSLSQR